MFRVTVLIVCGLWFAGGSIAQEDGWVELFDGQSLDGWTQRGGKASYTVEDQQIVGTTVPNTPNSFLCTKQHYDNFVLQLEFKVHPELNSGVQIRSNSLPEYNNGRVHGYQVEIDPSDRAWSAGIYDEGRRGWLFNLTQKDDARYAFQQDQWNKLLIIAIGNRIRTWLNGVPAADLTDDMTASGFIALQVHGVGGRQDPISVRWRNIRLRQVGDDEQVVPESQSIDIGPEKNIVNDTARVEKVADGFRFVEGPAMGPDHRIYFSDIPNERIHVFNPADSQTAIYRQPSGRSNGLMWTPNDSLVACEGGNRRVTRQFQGGSLQVIADKFEGKKLNSPNDLAIDSVGGLYFSDPRYGNRDDMELEIEGVYYVNRQRKLSRVIDDLVRPNGLVLAPDYKTLYVADAGDAKIWKYQIASPGKLAGKQLYAEIGSDGMTIDRHGNVYCTWQQSVHVFNENGNRIATIEIPERPANVTFGGTDGRTLYVTARTSLYRIETNVVGARTVPSTRITGDLQWTR